MQKSRVGRQGEAANQEKINLKEGVGKEGGGSRRHGGAEWGMGNTKSGQKALFPLSDYVRPKDPQVAKGETGFLLPKNLGTKW